MEKHTFNSLWQLILTGDVQLKATTVSTIETFVQNKSIIVINEIKIHYKYRQKNALKYTKFTRFNLNQNQLRHLKLKL